MTIQGSDQIALLRSISQWPATTVLMVALLVWPVEGKAQILAGQVLDSLTGQAVGGIQLVLVDLGGDEVVRARSSEDGQFELVAPEAGRYRLTVAAPGYEPRRSDPFDLLQGQLQRVSLTLTRLPQELTPIEGRAASATRRPLEDFWKRRERGFGDFLTRAEFTQLGEPQTPMDVLRRMQGVRVYRNANYGKSLANVNPRKHGTDDRRWVVSSSRAGPRSIAYATYECPPLLFVDRTFLGDPWYVSIDQVVALSDVEAVEVYNGTTNVPPELRRQGSECGAIVFWTR